jgi:hypothetical protein
MTRKMTRWPSHWDGGQRYDLSNVDPFKFDYVLPTNPQFAERIVSIQVSFTSHAFTRDCEADEVPHPHYCAPGEARRFDHERYKLSKLLPDIIRNIGNLKCFFEKYDNFFVFELPEGTRRFGVLVFFFLERADKGEEYALHLMCRVPMLANGTGHRDNTGRRHLSTGVGYFTRDDGGIRGCCCGKKVGSSGDEGSPTRHDILALIAWCGTSGRAW